MRNGEGRKYILGPHLSQFVYMRRVFFTSSLVVVALVLFLHNWTMMIKEVVKNGYFTVRLAVRGERGVGGVTPLGPGRKQM